MRRFCTVTTTNAAELFNGNGVTTVFPLTFVFFEASSLVVTLVQADGTGIVKTLTTDYTVSGGDGSTGSVTTTSFTPASGEQLVVERVEPATQGTDYVNNDTFDAETTETRFDRIVMALQNALDRAGRSLKVKAADASGIDTDLPSPVALKTFRWNSGATALEETDDPKVSADAAAVSAANAATSETNAAASASAASTSETNAATSETNAATSETNAATSETNAATSATEAEDQRGAVALEFTFSTTTAMADPGTGAIRFNNATPASVTAIAIDALSADDGNPDVSDFLALLDAVTSTVKGYLTLRKIGDPSFFMAFDVTGVTDNGGWLQATVTHVQGSTLPSNGDGLAISIGRTGDAQTSTMPSGTAASPGFPFSADPDTGIYRVAEDSFGIATGGVQAARFDASQNLVVAGALDVGDPATTRTNLAAAGTGVANTFTANQTLQSGDAGASLGPSLSLYRNSASPASSDNIGAINIEGESSTGARTAYGRVYGRIIDPSNSAEDGQIILQTIVAGVLDNRFLLGAGLFSQNATGGDQGADSINASSLYEDGVSVTAKVWGYVTYSGGTPTLQASNNVTSITDAGTGLLTVTIATDFASANYAVSGSVARSTGVGEFGEDFDIRAAGTFEVIAATSSGTLTDPDSISFAAFGEQ